MHTSQRLLTASLIALVVAGMGTAFTSSAVAESASSDTTPEFDSLVSAIPGLADLTLPASLDESLAGLPNGPLRDYGTPTAAPDKVCPFVGDIPVSLPIVSSPVGTSLPGLAGIDLASPAVSTFIHGELCMSTSTLSQAKAGKSPSVLLLNHGITYGTYYWDFPYQPDKYSTVNYLDKLGFATLNIDRVGDGASGHPLSPLVNAQSEAVVTHELVQGLKAGAIGSISFPHVGLVGHSYGTVIDWIESAMYNDTDLDIGTGYSDRVDPVSAGEFIGMSTPALASPLESNQPWAIDPGYLQPLPTARTVPQLYNAADVDPKVESTDASLANTVTVGEVATFVEREYDGTHKNIRIPTFDVQGEYDIMTCGQDAIECQTAATTSSDPVTLEKDAARFTAWQSGSFSSQACFRSAVIPGAAHNVSLALNAGQTQAQIAFFALQAMGVHGENAAQYASSCAASGPSIFDSLPEITRLIPPFPFSSAPITTGILDPILGLLG
jgi:hypothetical protein